MTVTLRKLILERLVKIGEGTLDACFPRQYPEARLWRELLGLDKKRQFSKRSFSAILSQLKAEGLVTFDGSRKSALWRATSRGRECIEVDRMRQLKIKKDGVARLVIFDVPEKERGKRDILRYELISLGYSQLQKSVWIGHFPLPEDFIELIEALRLRGNVHIFSVRELGTLRGV